MQANNAPENIGGWLAILVLILVVFSPLYAVHIFAKTTDITQHYQLAVYPKWVALSSGLLWVTGLAAAIKLMAGIGLLLYERKSSVLFAIAALWISDVGGMIAETGLKVSIFPDGTGTPSLASILSGACPNFCVNGVSFNS